MELSGRLAKNKRFFVAIHPERKKKQGSYAVEQYYLQVFPIDSRQE